MAYDYSGSTWDNLTYKSKSGGYKLKAGVTRDGATIADAVKALGAPPAGMNITGYNPNIASLQDPKDSILATNLGLLNSSGTGAQPATVTGGSANPYQAAKPTTTTTTTQQPAQTTTKAPTYTTQAIAQPLATMTLGTVEAANAPINPQVADMKLRLNGLLADKARLDGLVSQYRGTESEMPYTDQAMALARQIEALNGQIAAAAKQPAATQPQAAFDAFGVFGPAATAAQPPTGVATPTPVQMANQGPGAGTGFTTVPAGQAAGAGLSVPTPAGPIQGGKVISEGGANQSSGAQIPADGQPTGTNAGQPAGGSGLPAGGGAPPVVTPPYTGGVPAAGAPSPSQQGTGLTPPLAPIWTQATTTGGGAAPGLSATPAYAPWVNAPTLRDPYTGLTSQLAGLQNPFDEAYARAAEGRAIDMVEEQRKAAALTARSRAADRGLLQGGSSGILAADLAGIDNAAFGQRIQGLRDAATNTANQRATFGLQRAQGLDAFEQSRAQGMLGYDKANYDRYRDLQMAPVQLEQAKAQVAGQLLQNDQDRQNLELIRQNWDLIRQKEQAGLQLTLAELDMKKWLAENSGWLSILNMGFQALPGLAGLGALK